MNESLYRLRHARTRDTHVAHFSMLFSFIICKKRLIKRMVAEGQEICWIIQQSGAHWRWRRRDAGSRPTASKRPTKQALNSKVKNGDKRKKLN